jgi:TPR repeat protein
MMKTPPSMDGVKSCPARSFERTCAANDAWGCAMYGLILSRDKSDPRNSKRALDMFEKACQSGENDPACRSATSLKRDLR